MKKYAIIVAGGVGSRSGDSLPKQFHDICGHPMLWWSIDAFSREDSSTHIIVVMHPAYMDYWDRIKGDDCPAHTVTAGGATRTESVWAGLRMAAEEDDEALVAVHDAARPMVAPSLIEKCWASAKDCGACLPAMPVSDTLRRGSMAGSAVVDRNEFFTVQTPQTFGLNLLKGCYTRAMEETDVKFTDDASVVERYGMNVRLIDGDASNFKVTWPNDFVMAEALLNNR